MIVELRSGSGSVGSGGSSGDSSGGGDGGRGGGGGILLEVYAIKIQV